MQESFCLRHRFLFAEIGRRLSGRIVSTDERMRHAVRELTTMVVGIVETKRRACAMRVRVCPKRDGIIVGLDKIALLDRKVTE